MTTKAVVAHPHFGRADAHDWHPACEQKPAPAESANSPSLRWNSLLDKYRWTVGMETVTAFVPVSAVTKTHGYLKKSRHTNPPFNEYLHDSSLIGSIDFALSLRSQPESTNTDTTQLITAQA